MINVISEPNYLSSVGNPNWVVLSSTLRFAPKFNLLVDLTDGSGNLYNSVILPTTPDNINILNIKNILYDYVLPDFNCFITGITVSTAIKPWKYDVYESFAGLYVTASSTASIISRIDVIGNLYLNDLDTPALVESIGFDGGSISNDVEAIWIYDFGTGPDGFINSFTLSQSTASYVGVTGSIGTYSYGYIQLVDNPEIFSYGYTISSTTKQGVLSNFDYLDYNESDNYTGYYIGTATSSFLTSCPREIEIGDDEYHTLSFIQSTSSTANAVEYKLDDNTAFYLGLTAFSGYNRIDIPAGPANLTFITQSYTGYTIRLVDITDTSLSEEVHFSIKCSPSWNDKIRLCWWNKEGGVDYWTFRFMESKNRRVERGEYNKNLNFSYTKSDRGTDIYKIRDWSEYTIVTDLLTDDEINWLSGIITSPDVYWIRGSELIPISIMTDFVSEISTWEGNNLSLNFKLSRTNSI